MEEEEEEETRRWTHFEMLKLNIESKFKTIIA